jgi:hypothetical protein
VTYPNHWDYGVSAGGGHRNNYSETKDCGVKLFEPMEAAGVREFAVWRDLLSNQLLASFAAESEAVFPLIHPAPASPFDKPTGPPQYWHPHCIGRKAHQRRGCLFKADQCFSAAHFYFCFP